ncbi:hypothetical protein HPULCUR_002596 [Helicostylum pulchrum]|uniref:Uncharacterized protein n=1 Tax=Helicostylum pulchrum TaxID=562976 RepID=A0ABP9XR63_9FUNG
MTPKKLELGRKIGNAANVNAAQFNYGDQAGNFDSQFTSINMRQGQQQRHILKNLDFNPPNQHDRSIINGFDFSTAFYGFQLELLKLKNLIPLESHVHHIL